VTGKADIGAEPTEVDLFSAAAADHPAGADGLLSSEVDGHPWN